MYWETEGMRLNICAPERDEVSTHTAHAEGEEGEGQHEGWQEEERQHTLLIHAKSKGTEELRE